VTTKNIVSVTHHVQPVLASIRAELDDHLMTINENTDELNQNFASLEAVNNKIDRLAERVEQIALFLKNLNQPFSDEKKYHLSPLTKKEKVVFSALYSLLTGGKAVTYKALAKEVCMPESLVCSYITNLMEKGIPVLKRRSGKTVNLSLERAFQEKQAKENIVGVNTLLTHWVR